VGENKLSHDRFYTCVLKPDVHFRAKNQALNDAGRKYPHCDEGHIAMVRQGRPAHAGREKKAPRRELLWRTRD
jgi:hypothetical protein